MTAAPSPVPDITNLTLKAAQLSALDQALAGIFVLSPPPSPKGRYALAKAAKVIGPAHALYQEQRRDLLAGLAQKDDEGKPVTQIANGVMTFDFGQGFGIVPPSVHAALAELNDEDVVLTGCRMISHAELGDCPITVQQEAALLGVLLIDEEPT